MRTLTSMLASALGCAMSCAALAAPWAPPGDVSLRHDIQLLADEGVIQAPITTWPLSWPDISRDVLAVDVESLRTPYGAQALTRVQRAARAAAQTGPAPASLRVAAAEEPAPLRDFRATPREEGELEIALGWTGERFAAQVNIAAVADADDGKSVRYDGSYLAASIGNFMVSAGAMERWWGPGWEGSLILSNNARPVPSLTIERNYSDAPRWRLLRWVGPWRIVASMGRMEGSDIAVPDVRLFAMRFAAKPRPWLEIGLSRTAQWCGEGRPCDLDTFGDLLVGRDNVDASLGRDEEPGNQLAGYDVRLRSPWRRLPLALYAQMIGEDEAGGLPSRFLGLGGAEVWGGGRWGTWRIHAEYAETSCNFSRETPLFDCAYRHGLYPQGYTYRGRPLGHALGGDGQMYSFGLLLTRPQGDSWTLLFRDIETDRGGASPEPAVPPELPRNRLKNLELQYNRAFARGALGVGVGLDDFDQSGRSHSGLRGFVQWRQRF